jgi:hypothetical protein
MRAELMRAKFDLGDARRMPPTAVRRVPYVSQGDDADAPDVWTSVATCLV